MPQFSLESSPRPAPPIRRAGAARLRIGRPLRLGAALLLAAAAAALAPPPALAKAPGASPVPVERPAFRPISSVRESARFVRPPAPVAASPAAEALVLDAEAEAARLLAEAEARAEALIAGAGITGHTGFALIDIATGAVLQVRHGDQAFPPASTVKALTALYALETFGPDHRFVTELRAARLRDGVAAGPVALVGGGDPSFDTDDLAALADAARAAGLRRAAGPFLADGAALAQMDRIDAEQSEDAAYNPAVGGLNLNYNRVALSWTRSGDGHALSMLAAADRTEAEVNAVAAAIGATGGGALEATGLQGGAETWIVSPDALGREGRRWLPVRRPAIYAADAFRALADARGIALPAPTEGPAPAGAALVARHESRPLDWILRGMLRYSTNLTAEALGLAASGARGARPGGLAPSAAAMSRWLMRRAALEDLEGLALQNHSGLSAQSRITPLQMARALRAAAVMGDDGMLTAAARAAGVTAAPPAPVPGAADGAARTPGVAAGAAAAGADPAGLPRGALHDLLRPVPLGSGADAPPPGVEARAKTGTLLFVRGLAGYLDAASGRRFAFAIFSEDLARRAAAEDLDRARGSTTWRKRAQALERRLLNAWARRL
ncbi:D-alanyl-D-alanine carboxypeptidase/D-alanyl-D-alanine endopeptidase [Rhodovulum sp. DZ06]|uniref:D-alanyl-D-alanine carboxypeptidase/D-alanyl-D-alanine endopeptidase n=1 Tax=Rhodovulum sp. DZ06 TaxID=3425126 RepID=UPI003D34097C